MKILNDPDWKYGPIQYVRCSNCLKETNMLYNYKGETYCADCLMILWNSITGNAEFNKELIIALYEAINDKEL